MMNLLPKIDYVNEMDLAYPLLREPNDAGNFVPRPASKPGLIEKLFSLTLDPSTDVIDHAHIATNVDDAMPGSNSIPSDATPLLSPAARDLGQVVWASPLAAEYSGAIGSASMTDPIDFVNQQLISQTGGIQQATLQSEDTGPKQMPVDASIDPIDTVTQTVQTVGNTVGSIVGTGVGILTNSDTSVGQAIAPTLCDSLPSGLHFLCDPDSVNYGLKVGALFLVGLVVLVLGIWAIIK